MYAKPETPPTSNGGSTEQVWVAKANGRQPRLLAVGADPSVSADGRYVAFYSGSNTGGKVLVMPTTGGAATTVYTFGGGTHAGLARPPVWAPDSRHLAFQGYFDGRLVLFDIRSGKLTKTGTVADDYAFSPDSQRIVYESRADLYVMPSGGGRAIRLTHDHKSYAPVWGKPGIAFVRFTHGYHGDVWLTDGRPGHARQLTHTDDPFRPAFFSADGRELLAADPAMNNGRLWAVDVSSGRARALTPWVGDLFPQGLSRDGKTVLAAIGCGGTQSPYGVVETIPFAGGGPRVIARGPCRASWNS